MKVKIKDLQPLHGQKVSGARPHLRKLTDDQLLKACNKPKNSDRLKINGNTGKLIDGNGRTYELRRRIKSGSAKITPETEVECDYYFPDLSMFTDV